MVLSKKVQHSAGFTLIELIAVLALIAIITTVAIPTFSLVLQDNRLTTETNIFVGALNYARSEAVRRSERVTICRLGTGLSCDLSPCNPCDWSKGWMVALDRNGPMGWATPATPAVDERLRVDTQPVVSGQLEISGPAIQGYISFNPLGEPQISGGAVTGLFELYDGRGKGEGRQIAINAAGRVISARAQ